MSQQYFRKLTIAFFCVVLAACGGGGGGGDDDGTPTRTETNVGGDTGSNGNGTTNPNDGTTGPDGGTSTPPPDDTDGSTPPPSSGSGGGIPPSTGSGSGTPPSTGSGSGTPPSGGTDGNSGSPTPTNPSDGPFVATVTQAPEDGATINGTVRILVEGSGIQNIELLPATGYAPLTARGVVTGDNVGGYIDLDTTVIPDGQVTLRVAVFNAPPGQGGSEITAMQARTWNIQNAAAPTFTAQLVTAPPDQYFWLGSQSAPALSNTERFEVSGTNLGNVELVSAKDESVIYGRFTISPDRTRATLDWDYYFYNGWSYNVYNARIVAWDVPPGAAGRKIEVMAPRTYHNKLPLGCQAEGRCGGEAP